MITAAAGYMGGLGMTEQEIKDVLDTVSCNISVWYNPYLQLLQLSFYGVVMMIIHRIGFCPASVNGHRGKETPGSVPGGTGALLAESFWASLCRILL